MRGKEPRSNSADNTMCQLFTRLITRALQCRGEGLCGRDKDCSPVGPLVSVYDHNQGEGNYYDDAVPTV